MIDAISDGVLWIISRIASVLRSFFTGGGQWRYLVPGMGVAIAVSIIVFAVSKIKSTIQR